MDCIPVPVSEFSNLSLSIIVRMLPLIPSGWLGLAACVYKTLNEFPELL
jgi:hypothetical protein